MGVYGGMCGGCVCCNTEFYCRIEKFKKNRLKQNKKKHYKEAVLKNNFPTTKKVIESSLFLGDKTF